MNALPEAMMLIAKLGIAVGTAPLNKYTGCWEFKIDEQWWIAVNGHREAMACSRGNDVPPFSAYIVYMGWPAGIIAPNGGVIAAGDCANEDAFIDALQARLVAETETAKLD